MRDRDEPEQAVSTLTSKGQTTVPKIVRENLRLRAGQQIQWGRCEHGIVIRRRFDPGNLEKWRKHFKDLAGRKPDDIVEEMRGR